MKKEYIVTAIVKGKRVNLSIPLTYEKARNFIKHWKHDMRIAISKYKDAKDFKIQVVKGGKR